MSNSNIRKISQMDIAEAGQEIGSAVKTGYFITKKAIIIITSISVVMLVGVILSTHFGTKATLTSKPSTTTKGPTGAPSEAPSTTTKAPTEGPTEHSTTTIPEPLDYRLGTECLPFFYHLEVKPYIGPEEVYGVKAFTHEGKMTIHLNCTKPTKQLKFHALNLNIDGSTIEMKVDDGLALSFNKDISYDKEREYYILDFDTEIQPNFNKDNFYILTIPFSGEIITQLYGFYRNSYVENGITYHLASTKFEPTYARRAFPCFDEPAMKAQFNFTLTRHKNFTSAMFNTPRISSTPEGDWIVDKFEKTVKMSTYLVAYVISNFELIDMKSSKGVLIEVAGRPEAIRGGEGDFGLKESAEIIDFFSDYFGVDYPLEKSTQVGIPDFNSGAMENWGLVTYRESSLFYNEKSDTIENKIRVAKVIAHELAHQWYGNLVTMAWWNDLWLNEGFASWVENLGLNFTHPEWRHLDYFFINRLQTVLDLDSLESSHPISVDVKNPNNIKSIFDTISYSKGASVIRLMNAFLGESTFRKGVSKYLNDYQFSNTKQDDLWNTLNVAATEDMVLEFGLNVKDIMDSWTLQKGYPVVHMVRDGNTLKASQEWFLVNPDNKVVGTDEYFNATWFVPITYTTKSEKDFNFEKKPKWLKKDMNELRIDVSGVSANDWIIGNVKYAGYYRVNYDENNWKLLIDQLKEDHSLIDPTNRAGLLDDSFNLGRATTIKQTVYLDITKYLEKEEDPLPLRAVFNGLEYIYSKMVLDSEGLPLLNQYYRNILLETYKRLGWRTDLKDANEISLQTSVLRIMCRSGYQPCVNQAQEFYGQFITNQVAIPSDFKTTVYYTVIEQGDDAAWQDFYERTLAEQNPAEKLRMLKALTKSKNLITLKFFLDKTADPAVVKKQDEPSIVTAIASNAYGQQMVFDYMDEKWDSLLEQYGDVSFTLPNIVSSVTANLNSDFDLEKLNRFMVNHPYLGIAEPAFNNALEKVAINNKWVKTNRDSIKKWLKDNVKPDPVTTITTTAADLTSASVSMTTTTAEKINVRLPADLKPILYELEIRPYIGPSEVYGDKAFTFDGKIAMTLNCVNPTNKILFHGLNLNITESGLELYKSEDNVNVPFSSELVYDSRREYYTMTVNEDLEAGKQYTLVVPYRAGIVDRLDGFYRQQYVENGKTFYLASTHFEPTDARRAFPCFDEPALKAEWQLTVIRHNTFSESLFNTPLIDSKPYPADSDWIVDRFEKSVLMSTYLVAFVVSNLEKITMQSPRYDVTIEVYARPEAIKAGEGDFALKEAAEIIDYFSEYFKEKYPLKKSTQVAVPNFGAGAMENWGLVIYREASLLYNNITDTIANKRRVSLVVAHELAHQWYGNLVTMAWWTDLWLNEGFASWVENLGLNRTHPEWRDLDYFYTSRISVMEDDSLESSHPVSVEVNEPGEIGAIFDSISYDKGASVIRMMNAFLSEPTFRKGVSYYLNTFKYQNTVQDNLFEELNRAAIEDKSLDASITVKDIMNTWTLQKGYPVVNMKRDGDKLISSQKWFLLSQENTVEGTEEYDKMKWYVPITYTSKSEKDFNFEKRPVWLKPDMEELLIDVSAVAADEWIVGNVKHAGFYRVNYDENNWKLLIAQLKEDHLQIDATSRAALLDDSFNLGRAGKLNQTVYLDISSYLEKEEDPLAYLVSFSGMGYISNMFEAEKETSDLMSKFYIKLLLNVYNKLGWRTDLIDANDLKLQLSVLSVMCRSGYQPCINRANEYYHDFADFNEPIPADFKTTVYNTFVESGDENDWEDLYQRALETTNAAEKLRMLRALTKSKNAYILNDYLNKALDEEIVKKQDQIYIIGDIANNAYGRRLAFDFMDKKWNYLVSTFGGLSSLSRLVTGVTRKLNTKEGLQDVKDFIREHPEGTTNGIATAAFQEAIETVTSNVRWMGTNKEPVVSWLKTYLNPPPQPTLNYRLPQDLAPSAYRLSIKPYFKSTTKPTIYDGKVEIDFECVTDTKKFVIHYNNLDLDYSTLNIISKTDSDFKQTPAKPKYTYSPITHFFTIEFTGGEQFKAGNNYTFKIDFVGYTKEDNLGFYASKYQDTTDEKWIVSSQLETVEARKSFPCFDEPAMKAKFNLKLIHDSSLTAFSNMPIKQKTRRTASADEVTTPTILYDWVETTFDETPIMSTYLLAILVADYECVKDDVLSKSGQNIISQVCTRKNAMDQLILARNASIGALEALETLYNVPYPLPKLDHVSSPTFNFGAMENWGLAIYLERLFLKNENSTQTTEQRIVTIITHEIAHMWFGNLVTPKWWDDLWLNEGFARYMQFVGSDKLRPEWELLDQHVNMLLDVLDADAGNNVRALSQPANTPEEINAMVDPTITYGKGSGIVRMLNYVLGDEAFYEALTAYFEKHKYTNVDQFDLWLAMSEKGKEKNIQNLNQDISLDAVMSKWTQQAGHPVVMVKLDKVNEQLIVTQKQFKRDPLAKKGNFKWTIPFTYSIESYVKPTTINNMNIDNIMDSTSFKWIKPDEEVTIIGLNGSPQPEDFVLANIEMTGYFRVNYEPDNWAEIIKRLDDNKKIPSTMKAQLINDAFALSESTDVEADLPLKIISAVSQSQNTEYLPWSAFLSRYSYYSDMFYSSRIGSDLKERMATVIEPLFKSYKESADKGTLTWNQRLIRPKVYSFACSHEVEACKSAAIDTFSEIIANSSLEELDSLDIRDIKQVITCTAIRHGSKAEFDSLFNLIDTKDSSMLDLISASLSCTRSRPLLEKFLYKSQEFGSSKHVQAIRNAIAYSGADDLVWSYIKTKWDTLVLDNTASTLKSLLEKITMKFNNKYQKDDFELFFELHPNIELDKDIEVMKQKINTNRYWFNRSLETVNKWLVDLRNLE